MTIHLPEDLERSIRDEVRRGHFASVDDADRRGGAGLPARGGTGADAFNRAQEEAPGAHKPIWEEIEEITAGIPDEEWLKLPADGAEQHDHYIYGTPKRPPTS